MIRLIPTWIGCSLRFAVSGRAEQRARATATRSNPRRHGLRCPSLAVLVPLILFLLPQAMKVEGIDVGSSCNRHFYNQSDFSLLVKVKDIPGTNGYAPLSVEHWDDPALDCTPYTRFHADFCMRPHTAVSVHAQDEGFSGPVTFISAVFPSRQVTYILKRHLFAEPIADSCMRFEHDGETGPYIGLNDPAILDVKLCEGHCGIYAGGTTRTQDVLCTARGRPENEASATSALALPRTGESACIARARSSQNEGFDIQFGPLYGRSANTPAAALPPGESYLPQPSIVSFQPPATWQRVDDRTFFLQQGWNRLTATVPADRPGVVHFQFSGGGGREFDPDVKFGSNLLQKFRVVMKIGPAAPASVGPSSGVEDLAGGTMYLNLTPMGSNLDPPVYGGLDDPPAPPGGCRMVLTPGSNPTLTISVDGRSIVKDKRLAVPRGVPLPGELTIYPTFADNDTYAAFGKLTTSIVTEARYLFNESKTADKEYELYITSSNSGRRDHWLIKGPDAQATRILTPKRDFITDKIIPTLTKPMVDTVTAAFASCTEAQCELQTYGPYGASQTLSYVVKFFANTGSLDSKGWWTFASDGAAGPWRVSRPAPPTPRPGPPRPGVTPPAPPSALHVKP